MTAAILICHCFGVYKEDLEKELQQGMPATLEAVKEKTKAGSRCGSCIAPGKGSKGKRAMYLEEVLQEFTKELHPLPVAGPMFQNLSLIEKIHHIQGVLDLKIRPILKKDGGDVEILEVLGTEIVLGLKGACDECPSSRGGTLGMIRQTLKKETKVQELEIKIGVIQQ